MHVEWLLRQVTVEHAELRNTPQEPAERVARFPALLRPFGFIAWLGKHAFAFAEGAH